MRGYESIDKQSAADITRGRCQLRIHLLAHWRLYRWSYLFTAFVVGLQLSLGIWQCHKYATNEAIVDAFSWGPAAAKLAAGALYSTTFFMVLSMSRWLATIARFLGWGKFVNWDRYRFFHIRMAITALSLSILHTFAHVFGTFPSALRPERSVAAQEILGSKIDSLSWSAFLLSRPGWTGLGALSIFVIVATFSTPAARRKSFEIFQASHLLIFPMLGLLAFHGSAEILQQPAMGYVLAFPCTVVLFEKLYRMYQMFRYHTARISPLPGDCVEVVIFLPRRKKNLRFYRPGQYILVRVPTLSRFQWHPFTVVQATSKELLVIAKDNGYWTKGLQGQPEFAKVNLDGPFGAPSQSFWHYDNNILIGMGTGLTPSAAIISELVASPPHRWLTETCVEHSYASNADVARKRLLVLWIIRDAKLLQAFDSLFKSVASLQLHGCLSFDFHLYISRVVEDVEALDKLRMPGVIIHHGKRPVFGEIFTEHHRQFALQLRDDVLRTCQPRFSRPRTGVFFCGGAAAKSELRKICLTRTIDAIRDGSEIQYHFHPEVF